MCGSANPTVTANTRSESARRALDRPPDSVSAFDRWQPDRLQVECARSPARARGLVCLLGPVCGLDTTLVSVLITTFFPERV